MRRGVQAEKREMTEYIFPGNSLCVVGLQHKLNIAFEHLHWTILYIYITDALFSFYLNDDWRLKAVSDLFNYAKHLSAYLILWMRYFISILNLHKLMLFVVCACFCACNKKDKRWYCNFALLFKSKHLFFFAMQL